MELAFLTVILLGFGFIKSSSSKCEDGYERADLYNGKRYLRNYRLCAKPNGNSQDALRMKSGDNPKSLIGAKGEDAEVTIEVRGYRPDVNVTELCFQTKCVERIVGVIEGPYAPLKIETDDKGNIVSMVDIGTALFRFQEEVNQSPGWKKTCIPDLGRISKLTLIFKVKHKNCAPKVAQMFMKACRDMNPQPAICLSQGKVYHEGDIWWIPYSKDALCQKECRCTKKGKPMCRQLVCE